MTIRKQPAAFPSAARPDQAAPPEDAGHAEPAPDAGLNARLRSSWRLLAKELTAFGFIGALAFGIDLGIFAALSPHGALKAKCVSTIVSTLFAYFGNRYLSFSHRARTSLGREATYFFGINLIWLGVSELIIALFVYPLHYGHASHTVFLVNVGTVLLGTAFRYWAYKRFVFLHPDRVPSRPADLDPKPAQ